MTNKLIIECPEGGSWSASLGRIHVEECNVGTHRAANASSYIEVADLAEEFMSSLEHGAPPTLGAGAWVFVEWDDDMAVYASAE